MRWLFIFLLACNLHFKSNQIICVMVDVSGTYEQYKNEAVKTIKVGVLSKISPGDRLLLISIDDNSYQDANLHAVMAFDLRPSIVHQQTKQFSNQLDQFAKTNYNARYTDISGALMLCADYMRQIKGGRRKIIIFSDMKETRRRNQKPLVFGKDEFKKTAIAAINVRRLETDKPEVYRNRLKQWEDRLSTASATDWHLLVDVQMLEKFITQ